MDPRLVNVVFVTGVILTFAGSVGHIVSLRTNYWEKAIGRDVNFGLFKFCSSEGCIDIADFPLIWEPHSGAIIAVTALTILAVLTSLPGSILAFSTLLPKSMKSFMNGWNRLIPYACLPLSILFSSTALGVYKTIDLDDLHDHHYFFASGFSCYVFIASSSIILIGTFTMFYAERNRDDDEE